MEGPGYTWRTDEPLARHTPTRTGGPAQAYVVVHRVEGLAAVYVRCKQEGLKRNFLGAGSRTIFRDGEVAGAVIRLGHGFCHLKASDGIVEAGAGLPLAALCSVVPQADALAGVRHAMGSVGASIATDEGWEPFVDQVAWFSRSKVKWGSLRDFRSTRGQPLVVGVRLKLAVQAELPDVQAGARWFDALDGDDVAAAFRAVGLQNARLRSVLLPEEHLDRLVHLGGGSARDLALFQKSIIDRVHKERGVRLGPGLAWVGRG